MLRFCRRAINRGRGGHGEVRLPVRAKPHLLAELTETQTAIGLAAPVGQTASQSYEDSRKVLRGSHTHSNLDLNRQPPFATNSSPNSSREAQVGGTTLYSGSGGAARHVRRSVGAFCGTPQPNISQPSPQPGFNTYPPAAQQPPFANFANNHSMGYGPAAWAANRPHVPMSSDPQIVSWFKSQDRNNRGLINDLELRSALMNGDRTNFDIDTIRMLMTLFDTNRSGEIDEQEFQGIWGYLRVRFHCFPFFSISRG